MDIELVEYIGQLRNDTPHLGKGYIFNITFDKSMCEKYNIDEKTYSFDVMLFMHINIQFVTLHISEIELGIDDKFILNSIIEKYGKEELL